MEILEQEFLFTPRRMRNSRTNQCHSDVTLLGPSRESDPTISGQTLCDIWKILYSTSQYPPMEENAGNMGIVILTNRIQSDV